MHLEVLIPKQKKLLPLLKKFSSDFGLVGGTAIALAIGHRRSIDFDLFSNKLFNNQRLRKKIISRHKINNVLVNQKDEYTVIVDGVKITFLFYDFKINYKNKFKDIIKMPDLLTLAAMKAYALGMRAKWKDYVDLYFIMTKYHSRNEVVKQAQKIFGKDFNEKIFRAQLCYFKDVDFSEKVDYMEGFSVTDEAIKKRLVKLSLEE